MNKSRVKKLENANKQNKPYVTPKSVILEDGIYITDNGESLIEGKDGNLYYEDGTVFYDRNTVPDGFIGLIVRKYV